MRSLFLTLIVLLSSFGSTRAADPGAYTPLQQKDLNAFFSNVKANGGNLVFTRNDQYLMLQMQIGNAQPTGCLPSTLFEIPFGAPSRLFEGQSSLKFIPPAPKVTQPMFLVERITRSGNVHVGILAVDSGKNLKILPVPVTDKDSLLKFEKDWILGTVQYPSID